MKKIALTQGKVALIDDEDFEKVNQYKCSATKRGDNYYARYDVVTSNGKHEKKYVHRLIMDCPENKHVDHIDGNGLNNQKCNLRIVEHRQNLQNITKRKTSIYPGVSWEKNRGKWRASIYYHKTICLGRYTNEIDAFRAYYDFVLSIGQEILDFPYPSHSKVN